MFSVSQKMFECFLEFFLFQLKFIAEITSAKDSPATISSPLSITILLRVHPSRIISRFFQNVASFQIVFAEQKDRRIENEKKKTNNVADALMTHSIEKHIYECDETFDLEPLLRCEKQLFEILFKTHTYTQTCIHVNQTLKRFFQHRCLFIFTIFFFNLASLTLR